MSSLFANLGNPGEKKTGTLFGSTTAPAGGLFGNSQQPAQPAGGLFGGSTASGQQQPQNTLFGATTQPQQQQQQQQTGSGGLFASSQNNTGSGGGLFGQSQQIPQQPQQQNFNNSLFGGMMLPVPTLNPQQAQAVQQAQHGLPQLRQSAQQPFKPAFLPGQREKSVVEQIRAINDKWDPQSPECVFKYYFYNSVKPEDAAFYGPGPRDDERKWEEALAKKPSAGSIPVLACGFDEIAARISYQVLAVNGLRQRLHEIDDSLKLMKDQHELNVATRITEAKRKHIVHTQRTLALATKVQILRNRGYVMDQAEEELKKKLVELEKQTFDPVLGGRQEEIWARMSGVRERAQILQKETEKLGRAVEAQQNGEVLSDEDKTALEKLLKDYDKQLEHLRKWIEDTKEEYGTWEKEKQQSSAPLGRR